MKWLCWLIAFLGVAFDAAIIWAMFWIVNSVGFDPESRAGAGLMVLVMLIPLAASVAFTVLGVVGVLIEYRKGK